MTSEITVDPGRFNPGDIVRARLRHTEWPLFLLVLKEPADHSPEPGHFSGAVLINLINDYEKYPPGYVDHAWQRERFDLSSWKELLSIAAILEA